jgi:hypothetical protein
VAPEPVSFVLHDVLFLSNLSPFSFSPAILFSTNQYLPPDQIRPLREFEEEYNTDYAPAQRPYDNIDLELQRNITRFLNLYHYKPFLCTSVIRS